MDHSLLFSYNLMKLVANFNANFLYIINSKFICCRFNIKLFVSYWKFVNILYFDKITSKLRRYSFNKNCVIMARELVESSQ